MINHLAPPRRDGGWGVPKAAQEVAMDYLLHVIRTGQLAAGDQVSPEAIAGQINVSHVPVREAIRRLEGRGVVTHIPRKGHFVTELNVEDLQTLTVLGRLLETEALQRAVPSISDDQLDRMRATIQRSRDLVGREGEVIQSEAGTFHAILLERNVPRLLLRQIDLLWSGMEAYRHFYYARPAYQSATCDDHQAILDAVAKRDVAKTIEVFNAHRASVADATKQVAPFAGVPTQ